jgi:hypothetical protein
MRLVLPLPSGWTVLLGPARSLALSPESTASRPLLALTWGPLVEAAREPTPLWRQALEVDLEGRALEVDRPIERRTDLGWAYTEVAARVAEAEERLAIVYRFDEWRGVVLARAFDRSRPLAREEALLAALARATPVWRGDGEVLCAAHLYEPRWAPLPAVAGAGPVALSEIYDP